MGPEVCLACSTQYEFSEHMNGGGGREGIAGQRNSASSGPQVGNF